MVDMDRVKQFGGRMLGIYTGGVLAQMIELGYVTGLFEAAKQGPATSDELAARAGMRERYVREWLGSLASAGIFTYDATTKRYALPEEHGLLLTGDGASNLAPMSRIVNHFGTHLPMIARCFKEGGGVPYEAYRPVFTQCMDDTWRRIYDQHLVKGFIGIVDGLVPALERGIRVLDIGCGSGHAMNVLAKQFPRSSFVGYDIARDAIDAARREAQQMRLTNTRFDAVDVTNLAGNETFDLITSFDAIHDQRAPDEVLRSVKRSLAPGGTYLMMEFKFSSNVEENIGNPFAPMYYGISVMHCMPVSLAVGGAGLGTVWGEQTAKRLLAEVGFTDIKVLDTPRPQNCVFVCR